MPSTCPFHSRFRRATGTIVVAFTLGLAAACAPDRVSAPEALSETVAPKPGTIVHHQGLMWKAPITEALTQSAVIGSAGGEIQIPELGFRLVIPAGAMPRDTMTITVTALPGRTVAYEFQPHGVAFREELLFSQQLDATNWLALGDQVTLMGGYFADKSQVNTQTGLARLDAFHKTKNAYGCVTFLIPHFSGYMVSTARSESPTGSTPYGSN